MRTLRLSLAGTVILSLFGGLSMAVVAQPESGVASGPAHEWVTLISSVCSDPDQPFNGGEGDGFSWLRDWTYRCQEHLSDPRVSGVKTGTFNRDCLGPEELTCVYWGTEELVGPDGIWSGRHQGTVDPSDVQASYKVMTGSGKYEGLTFIWHGTGTLARADGFGLIYEGAAPPPVGGMPGPQLEPPTQ